MQLAEVDFDVWLPADLLRLDELMHREFETAAKHTAVQGADRLRHKIVEGGAVASSALLNSIDWEVDEEGYDLAAVIFSTEQHAVWVEEGRGPGPVPVGPIIEWMMDKGITPRDGDTLEQAAHAIANHIAKTGFEGRHYFETTLDEMESIAIEAIERAVARINRRLS
ncbi:MAG TPA: HK97 gp10 family phage protein [Pyrinomonadaceae bacterium]|jgi:hypothetical protein